MVKGENTCTLPQVHHFLRNATQDKGITREKYYTEKCLVLHNINIIWLVQKETFKRNISKVDNKRMKNNNPTTYGQKYVKL